jgi:8-oxo-dGTP diphosphatase
MARRRRPASTPPHEKAAIEAYDPGAYPRPSVTVDLVIFTVTDSDLKVLLIQRGAPPFEGGWALPGGFVRVGDAKRDQGESLEDAAERELAEETSLPRGTVYLAQLHTFGDPGRDPRMRVITVAYYALVRPDRMPLVRAGSDAAAARWFSLVEEVPSLVLAFDHCRILEVAVERLRKEIEEAPIAFELVPATFTVAELRAVHEAIKGTTYDAGNFRRRFLRLLSDGVIEAAPGKRATGTKPASVYRFVRG